MRRFLLLIMLAIPAVARSQTTLELRVSSAIGQTLGYSSVEIPGYGSRFTNESGTITVRLDSAGTYRIRIKHLGYKAADTTITVNSGMNAQRLSVTLAPIVVRVATTSVRGKTSCRVVSEGESELGKIVGEVRKNAERELLLRKSYPFMYRLARNFDVTDEPGRRAQRDTVEYGSEIDDKYVPGQVVRDTKNPVAGATRELRIPTLADLADESFLKVHCFYYRGVQDLDGVRVHRVDFEPVPGFKRPDVRGTAYLDEKSFIIKQAVFTLDRPHLLTPPILGVEVTTTYREIFPGLPLVELIRGVQQMTTSRWARGERVEEQRLVAVHFLDRMPGQ